MGMSRKIAAQQDDANPVFIWAERDDRPRLIVDDDLNVHWENEAAHQLLKDIEPLQYVRGRLVPGQGCWADEFRAFVRSSCPHMSMLCLDDSQQGHVLCAAIDVSTQDTVHLTGLTLRRTAQFIRFNDAALRMAFNFTSAERRIIETLFAGRTAEQASAGLQISVGTVRVHIRHIYDKLDVASREAMFHKLLPYTIV